MVAFLLLMLLAVVTGLLYRANGRRMYWDNHVLLQLVAQTNEGRCPRCDKCHPEALKRGRYWNEFKCPECNYTLSSHVSR